jgi:5'-nucleotidase
LEPQQAGEHRILVMMKILVTNDDGIHAPGLWALAAELKKVGEVVVFAPNREQSGIGTAITLRQPVRLTEVESSIPGIRAYGIEGTPADSVILALETVEDITMIFSGINKGANMGDDVLLSGTVGAALLGYLHNLPSIALSVPAAEEMHFEVAAKLAGLLARRIAARNSEGMLLNINLPNLPLDEIRGIEVTRVGRGGYSNAIELGHDGKGNNYRIVLSQPQWNAKEGTDIWAVQRDKISISPLRGELSTAQGIPLDEDLPSLLLRELSL